MPASLRAQEDRASGYRNTVRALAGITILEGEVGGTFGASYERRLGQWYGVGIFVDLLTEGDREFVIGPSFHLHPTRRISVIIAPAVDFRRDTSDLALLRMGVSYDIPLGSRWVLSPEINIDFVGGFRVLVTGVELGWRY